MKLVAKVKGRGYLSGVKVTSKRHKKSQAEVDAERGALSLYANSGRRPYVDPFKYIYQYAPVFKRNLSDLPAKAIFDSKEAFKEFLDYELRHDVQNTFDMSIVKIMTLDEYEADALQKRVIPSKKRPYYTNDILKLVKGDGNSKVPFCGACGTNIYPDEPRMQTQYATVCIHCLQPLAKQLTDEYEKVSEKYKGDYLLARSVDM